MKRALYIAVLFTILACIPLPVWADAINYNYAFNLDHGAGSVTGTFSYDTSKYSFASATITFNSSVFGNVTLTSNGVEKGNLFVYSGIVGHDLILYSILVNPKDPTQYWVKGTIVNLKTGQIGTFYEGFSNSQVPEGGEWYGYVMASGLILLAAVGLARQQRRKALSVALSHT
jgi:hypothetical protein